MAKAVAVGGGVLTMGAGCKGKGHVEGGAMLLMTRCNGNGRECATLLMVRCEDNCRGDAALSIGAHYDGKGSGSGVYGMLGRRMTTCRTITFLLANNRWTNNN
jgi:hypothetical protein